MLTRATLIHTAMATALTMTLLMTLKYAVPHAGHIGAGDDPVPVGTIERPPGATLRINTGAIADPPMEIAPRPLVVPAPQTARWDVDSVPMPSLPPMPVRTSKADREPILARATAGDITGSIPQEETQAPIPEERTFTKAEVIDGRTLKLDGRTVRLTGIVLPKSDRSCLKLDGTREACTERARTRLELFTAHRSVICTLSQTPKGEMATARCRVGTTDLAQWLVREGWVTPTGDATELASAAAEAKRMKIGIWR